MNLLDILGQEIPVRILQNTVKSGKWAHAYLFVGPCGVGKKSTAFAFAKLLNCKDRVYINIKEKGNKFRLSDLKQQDTYVYDACGKCISCWKVERHIHPDVSFISPDKKHIIISQMRGLKYQARFKSFEANQKIYIIDEAEKMTHEAANSVLKLLEEPPDKVLIILITQNMYSVLPTIVSRCQVIKFDTLSPALVVQYLKEKYKIEEEKALFFTSLSNGSIGRAFSYFEGGIDEKKIEVDSLINKIRNSDLESLFYKSEMLSSNKEELEKILSIMLVFYRQEMHKNPLYRYQRILEIILQTKEDIKRNVNPRLALDEMFLEIARIGASKRVTK